MTNWNVIGYGIEEYGIEYGVYTDENGNETIEVRDNNDIITVNSIDEAEDLCKSIMADWAEA